MSQFIIIGQGITVKPIPIYQDKNSLTVPEATLAAIYKILLYNDLYFKSDPDREMAPAISSDKGLGWFL